MPGQIPYIPFVGSGKAPEEPRRKTSVSGQPGRFATRTPEKGTDHAPGFALMGKPPTPRLRIAMIAPFGTPVDVPAGRGRTARRETGPGVVHLPQGGHKVHPTAAFTMEQKSSERLNTILETVGKILKEARYSGDPQSTDIAPPFPHLTPSGKRKAHRAGIPVPRSILDAAMGKVKNPGKYTGLRSTHVYVSDLPPQGKTPKKSWSGLMVQHGALP